MYMHIVLASLLLNMQKMQPKVLPRTERIYHLYRYNILAQMT
jgi:hypothetical protein